MYTENVAGGADWEFPKCKGGQSVYNILTFQKSRGQELTHPGGQMPLPPHIKWDPVYSLCPKWRVFYNVLNSIFDGSRPTVKLYTRKLLMSEGRPAGRPATHEQSHA